MGRRRGWSPGVTLSPYFVWGTRDCKVLFADIRQPSVAPTVAPAIRIRLSAALSNDNSRDPRGALESWLVRAELALSVTHTSDFQDSGIQGEPGWLNG